MNADFVRPEMTTGTAPKGQLIWLGLTVLVALSGLCTVFASVVTAAQAWQEHAQAQWPEVTAQVDSCGLARKSTGRQRYLYIGIAATPTIPTWIRASRLLKPFRA
jgi:hypothetical protein